MKLSLLACLLAILTASGAALPSPALWQCRHAARLVDASTVKPSAMPCGMAHGPRMACCSPPSETVSHKRPAGPALSALPCKPTLTRLAARPIASVSEPESHGHQSLASMQAALPLAAALLPATPPTVARQRPPPATGVPQAVPHPAPGLRAPPVA